LLIATHSGKFHADDVWGVTALALLHPGSDIIRTRDPARIATAEFAVDVGDVWDPAAGRFDHHQKGFANARLSGVVYASAGLVWKSWGARCVALIAREHAAHTLTDTQAQDIAYAIDNDLVQYLDMADTGAARSAPGGYGLSAIVTGFNPNWLDELQADSPEAVEALRLNQFRRAMDVMRDVMINQVKYRVGSLLAVERVRAGRLLEDGRVLFLDNASLPWTGIVRNEMPKVLFVISYSHTERRHLLHTVPAAADSFVARKDLPTAWAGLRDAALASVTGVPDAYFCHNARFIAAAASFDGVLALARQALAE